MPQKEIDELLHLELRLEAKLARERVKAQNLPIKALQEAKDAAKILQDNADKQLKILQENYTKEANTKCLKLQERAQKEIKIIESCHNDLEILARRTINELLGELTE